jgi:hypothetical protein
LHNYEHKKLIEAIIKLDKVPEGPQAFSKWIEAEAHLSFLRQNAQAEELVIFASGEYSFINTVAVPNDRLLPINKEDLLGWNFNPHQSIAGYVSGGGRKDVWAESGLSATGTQSLEGAVQLIFGRTFEGWSGPGRDYFELHQHYAHVSRIHWRPEYRAYCRYDEHGDIEYVVSVTTHEKTGNGTSLVSFQWKPLEEYLAASNASLVRMLILLYYGGITSLAGQTAQNSSEM